MKIQKLFEASGRQQKKNLQKEIARLKSEVPKAKQDEMQNTVLKYQYDKI